MLLVLFYAFKVFFTYLDSQKTEVIFSNPVFGKIPPPEIKIGTPSGGLEYVLDTVEGSPTTASPTAKVFFLPETSTKFGYREKIYLIAKNLGFDTETVSHTLSGQKAVFEDAKRRLSIDITNFNYDYEYLYATDEAFFQNIAIPDENQIQQAATDFLKEVGRYPEELAMGKNHILYFNLDTENNRLYATERPQEANVVEVDFYRPDVDAASSPIPVVPPSYFNSQNHVVMVFSESGVKVLRAKIAFFEKSTTQIGVYPLKTGDTAWVELKAGKGTIVANDTVGSSITVKKMFLGYFDPDTYQPYLEPVYVFLGDNNYVGYVPAVSNAYLSK